MANEFDPARYRVLVVDDDEGVRRMLGLALEDEGYTVDTAETGAHALEKLAANPADLIISDVRMPGRGGVDLLDTVRELDGYTPIFILMSGFTDVSPEDALARGATRFFHKPYRLDTLMSALEESLSGR